MLPPGQATGDRDTGQPWDRVLGVFNAATSCAAGSSGVLGSLAPPACLLPRSRRAARPPTYLPYAPTKHTYIQPRAPLLFTHHRPCAAGFRGRCAPALRLYSCQILAGPRLKLVYDCTDFEEFDFFCDDGDGANGHAMLDPKSLAASRALSAALLTPCFLRRRLLRPRLITGYVSVWLMLRFFRISNSGLPTEP